MGFLGVQYGQLLRLFRPITSPLCQSGYSITLWPCLLVRPIWKSPDALSLGQEAEVRNFYQGSGARSYLLYAVLQTGILLLLALRTNLPYMNLPLYASFEMVCFRLKAKFFTENPRWQALVAYEEAARNERFSLFNSLYKC